MFGTAVTGVQTFNTSFASLGEALMQTAVLIGVVVMFTQVGGQGIQKWVRGVALTLGIGAFFLKGYIALSTGTMALF